MKKLMTVLLMMLATQVAMAKNSFHGAWIGEGKIADNNDWKSTCPTVTFDITQTKDVFAVHKGDYDCEGMNVRWVPVQVNIVNGKLVYGETEVGTISENHFEAFVVAADGMEWTVRGGILNKQFYIYESRKQGDWAITTEAWLNKMK